MRFWLSVVLLAGVVGAAPGFAEEGVSDAPLQFAVLKADRVNLRRGPSFQHGVQRVYVRRGMPVAVLERFEHWRRIQDMDGETGWVHTAMLRESRRGARFAVARGEGEAPVPVRVAADAGAEVVVLLEPGLVMEALACGVEWCWVGVEEHRGWVLRAALWGIPEGETF